MSVKRRDLVKYLEQNGFSLLREGKKHCIYTQGDRTIPIRTSAMIFESGVRTCFIPKASASKK
jgi:predicted RNA binding protein YcfA (HicA-like mRNA interferase family)